MLLVSALIVVASASATVNIRDQMTLFQELDMDGNQIENVENPDQPQDAATKDYVDSTGSSPVYGSGADGEITKTGGSTNGVKYTTSYRIPEGSKVETSGTVIYANEEITINGDLDGVGNGGSGWDGATVYGDVNPPDSPSGGVVSEYSSKQIRDLSNPVSPAFRRLFKIPWGGRGGGGGNIEQVDRGTYIADYDSQVVGGSGGAMVTLVAPKVTVNGVINVSGTDGQDGSNCEDGEYRDDFIEDGANGGDGGAVIIASPTVDGNGDISAQKGQGGEGATCELGDTEYDNNFGIDNIEYTYTGQGDSGSSGSSGLIKCYDKSNSVC